MHLHELNYADSIYEGNVSRVERDSCDVMEIKSELVINHKARTASVSL